MVTIEQITAADGKETYITRLPNGVVLNVSSSVDELCQFFSKFFVQPKDENHESKE